MSRRHLGLLLTAVLLLALSACATPYQPDGLGGGYSDTFIDGRTVSVSFNGNQFTARNRVELDLLYRCAEITHNSGYDYFVLLDPETDVRHGNVPKPDSPQAKAPDVLASNTLDGRTTYFPDRTISFTAYGASTVMKMFLGKKPENNLRAYDAVEVMEYVGPKIEEAATVVGTKSAKDAADRGLVFTGNIIPDSEAIQ
jgi:hypothetical protein